jgi:hypothetical protein
MRDLIPILIEQGYVENGLELFVAVKTDVGLRPLGF